MFDFTLRQALVCLSLLLTSPAFADGPWQPGWFAAASAGAAGINFDTELDDIGDVEQSGFVGRAEVGYWLNRHWGMSVNYAELGNFEQRFDSGTFRGTARSYGASFLGRLPLSERWALVGKVNLVRTEMDDDGSSGAGFADLFGRETSLVVPSVELNYRLGDRLTLLLEVDLRGPAAKDVDVGLVALGARWHF